MREWKVDFLKITKRQHFGLDLNFGRVVLPKILYTDNKYEITNLKQIKIYSSVKPIDSLDKLYDKVYKLF